jgi:hypothetical protein
MINDLLSTLMNDDSKEIGSGGPCLHYGNTGCGVFKGAIQN